MRQFADWLYRILLLAGIAFACWKLTGIAKSARMLEECSAWEGSFTAGERVFRVSPRR